MRVEFYGCRFKGKSCRCRFSIIDRANFDIQLHYYSSTDFNRFLPENLCNRAVGLQRGGIKNKAMTASSSFNNAHAPFLGRLHRRKRGRFMGAWCARHNNHNQWLQVDLGRTMKIIGMATQGQQDRSRWVTSYWVLYGSDGFHFSRVTEWWDTLKVGGS